MAESSGLKYVELLHDGEEYAKIVEIIKSMDNCKLADKIFFIERVENAELNERFDKCKVPGEPIYMLHGTAPDNGTSIEQIGLTIKKSVRAAYGVGNYFTKDTGTVLMYMPVQYDYRQCYLCSVKLGKFGIDHGGNGVNIFCTKMDEQSTLLYRIGFSV